MRLLKVRFRCEQDVLALADKLSVDFLPKAKEASLKADGTKDLLKEVRPKRAVNGRKHNRVNYWDLLGMPEFVQNKNDGAHHKIEFHTDLDPKFLSDVFEQKITDRTRSIWFPEKKPEKKTLEWRSNELMWNQFPIYIISKGRPNSLTAQTLSEIGFDFRIIVEPQEQYEYRANWGDKVIVGDFDNPHKCSIPARNFVDKITTSNWYWLMDDNIRHFYRLNHNKKYLLKTPNFLRAAEDFVMQFDNVGQAGLNYQYLLSQNDKYPPYYYNTRVYSCILMRKDVENVRVDGELWRGKYNEDTDLSLRVLKAGYDTILINSFLAGKIGTLTMKGGNTDELYKAQTNNRLEFAESLRDQHPDVARVVWRYNRWHHEVDYRGFQTGDLKLKEGAAIPDYGLELLPILS
jgi:hypothetical protein